VAERRVAEVVPEHQALDELLVEGQRARHRPADLRALERVRQPRAVVVALVVHEHLGLVLEPAKRRTVDHPVAVTLEARAHRVLGLRVAAPAARGAAHRVGREALGLPALLYRPVDQLHTGGLYGCRMTRADPRRCTWRARCY